jgi:hypothetical protein
LTFATLVLALSACEGVPNLDLPGQSLRGEVSGNVTSKTKIAVIEGSVALDFTGAKVLKISNRQFSYALPSTETTAFLAAFEDQNNNDRWDDGEPITSDAAACTGCSYLQLTKVAGSWKVTEQTSSGPKSATLTDSNIAFKA